MLAITITIRDVIGMSPLNIFTVSFIFVINISLSFIDAALLKKTPQNYRVNIFCDLTLATLSLFPLDDYVPSILTLLKLQNEA